MEPLYDGKTKTVYALDQDRVVIVFKDDVTGTDAGIDPGANEVIGQLAGKGLAALEQSAYFFQLLEEHGVPTHFLSVDPAKQAMTAWKARWYGLEFVVRFQAWGSFVRRYGRYVHEGQELGGLVEITLKDDLRGDPLALDETLDLLGIMPLAQVREARDLARRAAGVLRQDLAARGLDLRDLKFECGKVGDRLVIIDDISTDNMRVVRDGVAVGPDELLRLTRGGGA
jgi:phosphoribosylaminoimidazole-succinocarboxamide synthase